MCFCNNDSLQYEAQRRVGYIGATHLRRTKDIVTIGNDQENSGYLALATVRPLKTAQNTSA
jgi:hypothetical protein